MLAQISAVVHPYRHDDKFCWLS